MSNTPIVASLLELNIICGRAADQAREAIREGLWLHLSDSPAYHAYRRLQDPSIINEAAAATASTRPWMRLHDAAVRQCLEMRKQLDAESNSARNLMAAAASVSSSREADAQAAFTTLAAVASFGLGIPALVLALYGADRILPLDSGPRQMAFLPVAAGFLLAAVIAVSRAPKGKSSWRWVSAAVGVILFLLTLLVAAGLLAPAGCAAGSRRWHHGKSSPLQERAEAAVHYEAEAASGAWPHWNSSHRRYMERGLSLRQEQFDALDSPN